MVNVCREDQQQSGIANLDDRRIAVEDRQQIFFKKQYDKMVAAVAMVSSSRHKAAPPAALDLPGAEILAGEGGARLAESVQHIVSKCSRLKAALEAAMTIIPRRLMADWITMLAAANTALWMPQAGRCAESSQTHLVETKLVQPDLDGLIRPQQLHQQDQGNSPRWRSTVAATPLTVTYAAPPRKTD